MNKKDLHVAAYENHPNEFSSLGHAGRAVDSALECIKDALSRGEKISINGFGTFEVKGRKARAGINPATGQAIQIPAKKAVRFRPAQALKEAVNT